MLSEILITNTATWGIFLSAILVIIAIITLILRIRKINKDELELKADESDLVDLRKRVEKKADREYVDIFINRLNEVERRHEVANTQLRSETLKQVEDINSKITELHKLLFELAKR